MFRDDLIPSEGNARVFGVSLPTRDRIVQKTAGFGVSFGGSLAHPPIKLQVENTTQVCRTIATPEAGARNPIGRGNAQAVPLGVSAVFSLVYKVFSLVGQKFAKARAGAIVGLRADENSRTVALGSKLGTRGKLKCELSKLSPFLALQSGLQPVATRLWNKVSSALVQVLQAPLSLVVMPQLARLSVVPVTWLTAKPTQTAVNNIPGAALRSRHFATIGAHSAGGRFVFNASPVRCQSPGRTLYV